MSQWIVKAVGRRRERPGGLGRGALASIALVALLLLGAPTGLARAGSPLAQVAAACAVPAAVAVAPPATPEPTAAPRRAAPTTESGGSRGNATPIVIAPRNEAARRQPTEAATASTPIAAADPAAALADELRAVTDALASCLSAGDNETVASVATENYLGQLYGGGEALPRDEYLALVEGIEPVPTRIRSVRDVKREGTDEATAEVVAIVGNQLLRSRWSFVQAPRGEREPDRSPWRVDGERFLAFDPPADAEEIAVTLEEYAIGLDETEVAGPALVLEGRNVGTEDHELLVLRFERGATTEDVLRGAGPGLPRGVSYVGQATVPVGDEARLVLVDLEPGDYAVVCLFPTPRGTPHLALGMEAAFEVTS